MSTGVDQSWAASTSTSVPPVIRDYSDDLISSRLGNTKDLQEGRGQHTATASTNHTIIATATVVSIGRVQHKSGPPPISIAHISRPVLDTICRVGEVVPDADGLAPFSPTSVLVARGVRCRDFETA